MILSSALAVPQAAVVWGRTMAAATGHHRGNQLDMALLSAARLSAQPLRFTTASSGQTASSQTDPSADPSADTAADTADTAAEASAEAISSDGEPGLRGGSLRTAQRGSRPSRLERRASGAIVEQGTLARRPPAPSAAAAAAAAAGGDARRAQRQGSSAFDEGDEVNAACRRKERAQQVTPPVADAPGAVAAATASHETLGGKAEAEEVSEALARLLPGLPSTAARLTEASLLLTRRACVSEPQQAAFAAAGMLVSQGGQREEIPRHSQHHHHPASTSTQQGAAQGVGRVPHPLSGRQAR
jgi:hypothetical protein